MVKEIKKRGGRQTWKPPNILRLPLSPPIPFLLTAATNGRDEGGGLGSEEGRERADDLLAGCGANAAQLHAARFLWHLRGGRKVLPPLLQSKQTFSMALTLALNSWPGFWALPEYQLPLSTRKDASNVLCLFERVREHVFRMLRTSPAVIPALESAPESDFGSFQTTNWCDSGSFSLESLESAPLLEPIPTTMID